MGKRLAGLLSFFFYSTFLLAQQRAVQGTVTDASDHTGLPGVNVIVEGTTKGTSTDVEGHYSIALEPGENALTFSFIGYKNQTAQVGALTVIDVALEQEATSLEEVVVVGYGTQRKSDLTGSVTSVRGEDLTKVPSFDPSQALQGKVAGVQVTSGSGAPGEVPIIRVRGVGTLNDASPIFVVDGVILDNISFLNPADIESMEVLKDASATAIYGSRGANGVIIITTKQGTAGNGKPSISFSGEYSMQQLSRKIDLLNGPEYATYVNDIDPNFPGPYNNINAVPNTDWQDLLFNSAPIMNYQLSASGGSENIQYYMGVGYFNQQGIVDKSAYERYTIKLNNTFKLADFIKVGNNLTFAPYNRDNTANIISAAYWAPPTEVPYRVPANPDTVFAQVTGTSNPLAAIAYTNNFKKGVRAVGNFFADVTFAKDFLFRSSFGMDVDYNQTTSFTPVFYVSPQQKNEYSKLDLGNYQNRSWLWENTLTYSHSSGDHRIEALAGYTMQKDIDANSRVAADSLLRESEDFWYISSGVPSQDPDRVGSGKTAYSLLSYLFRVNYTLSDKYLLTATYRIDGSSKFGANNKYGGFPSFALGWNISDEDFMSGIANVSNLKLRASWGVIGNEKIPQNDQYALVDNNQSAVFGSNESLYQGASFGKTGNPDLKWESTKQTDVGVELGLLNNKLTGEFDYYRRVTDDILVDLATPGHIGNGEGVLVRYNAASVLNTGLEFSLAYTQVINDFKYRIGALGSTLHNEVLELGGNSGVNSYITKGFLGNGQSATRTEVGNPIGAFYGFKIDGIFQNQSELDAYPHDAMSGIGDFRFVDINNDGTINSEDRTYIGTPIPDFIYGFNFEVSYKGLELSGDFQGQLGNDIYNGKEAVRPSLFNYERHVVDHWTTEGSSTTEPRASAGGINYVPSEHFVQDGSYLRLRTLTLGYDLPPGMTKKLGASNVRAYVRGTNLFTTTKFTGYTPEVASDDVLSNGIDRGTYPVTSVYSVGLNATF